VLDEPVAHVVRCLRRDLRDRGDCSRWRIDEVRLKEEREEGAVRGRTKPAIVVIALCSSAPLDSREVAVPQLEMTVARDVDEVDATPRQYLTKLAPDRRRQHQEPRTSLAVVN